MIKHNHSYTLGQFSSKNLEKKIRPVKYLSPPCCLLKVGDSVVCSHCAQGKKVLIGLINCLHAFKCML